MDKLAWATVTPRKCLHPKRKRFRDQAGTSWCECGYQFDPTLIRQNRNNKKRGGRHELTASRLYGGEKTGPLNDAEDIRGKHWKTQVKSRKGLAPEMWRKAFAGMDAQRDGRTPRILMRYSRPGVPADDYFVIRGSDWLAWFGRDEEDAA